MCWAPACLSADWARTAVGAGKVDFDELQSAHRRAADLAARLGIDTNASADGYPHFYTLDTREDESCLEISVNGAVARDFLHIALTSDIAALKDGESQPTHLLEKDGSAMASGSVTCVSAHEYKLNLAGKAERAVAWLRSLSDATRSSTTQMFTPSCRDPSLFTSWAKEKRRCWPLPPAMTRRLTTSA